LEDDNVAIKILMRIYPLLTKISPSEFISKGKINEVYGMHIPGL
jgi:hypothetical protein